MHSVPESSKRLLQDFDASQTQDFEKSNNLESSTMRRKDISNTPFHDDSISDDRKEFLNKYAIDFQLPNSYIEEVVFYPKDPTIILLFINYYNPDDDFSEEAMNQKRERKVLKSQAPSFLEVKSQSNLEVPGQDSQSVKIVEHKRQRQRKSAIVVIQEANQSFKLLNEKIFDHYLKGRARFSPDGSMFAYQSGIYSEEFTITKSATIKELKEFETFCTIPKSTKGNDGILIFSIFTIKILVVKTIKFNEQNNIFAIVYKTAVDMFDLPSEQMEDGERIEKKTTLKILDNYDYILEIGFNTNDKEKRGSIALKTKDLDVFVPSIHIYQFQNDKLQIFKRIQEIKFGELLQVPQGYLFEFTPDLRKAIVTTFYENNIKQQTDEEQECITYIYDIDTELIHQVNSKKQIRHMSVVENYNDDLYINPFVSLASNPSDKKCYLKISDKTTIELEFPFEQKKCKIADIDSRIDKIQNEFDVRVAFVKDQEKLCLFTYKEEIVTQFDTMFNRTTPRQEDKKDDDLQDALNESHELTSKKVMFYREYQEYQISNFQYPFIAYNDLSRKIRVKFLDKSRPDLIINMPEKNYMANISQIRILPSGQLYFMLEDMRDINIYSYDLLKNCYENNGKPLISTLKINLEEGCCIVDMWVNSREISSTSKKFFQGSKSYDTAFFFRTFPNNNLYVMYQIQKVPQLLLLSEGVSYFHLKTNKLFYIRNKNSLEAYNWQSFDIESKATVLYVEQDGQIISFIPTNQLNYAQIVCQLGKDRYMLKQLKINKEFTNVDVVCKIEINDKNLIQDLIQQQGSGFIENAKDDGMKLYLSGGSIYCLDNQKQQQAQIVKFSNILNLKKGEYVLSQYPRVNQNYLKTLYLVKNNKNDAKRGIIMPSLLSDNIIRLEKVQSFKRSHDQYICFLLTDDDVVHDDKDREAVFKFDVNNRSYSIINIKGEVLSKGSFTDVYKEEFGKITTYSSRTQIFAAYNQNKKIITIFRLEIEVETLNVNLRIIMQYKCQMKADGNSLKMYNALQQQINAKDMLTKNFQVNNKGDLLITINNNQTNEPIFRLFEYKNNRDKLPIMNQSSDQNKSVQVNTFDEIQLGQCTSIKITNETLSFKGYSLSDHSVIAWTETKCQKNKILATKIQSELSLKFDVRDNHQFFEVIELPTNLLVGQVKSRLFACKIESQSKSHMMIIWDEERKMEVSSADVHSYSQILLDHQGLAYSIDCNNGLLDMGEEAGGCKNLGFRKIIAEDYKEEKSNSQYQICTKGQKVKVVKIIAVEELKKSLNINFKAGNSKDIHLSQIMTLNKSQTDNRVPKFSEKYLKYVLIDTDIGLPYSYYQLIVKERIESIAKKAQKGSRHSFQQFEKILRQLSTNAFAFQIRNNTLFHSLAQSFKELQVTCEIFAQKDPGLLDMLLLKNQYMKTPLEMAIESKNPRCINLIMILLAQNCSETLGKCTYLFKEHFSVLIDQPAFKEFIEATFYKSDHYKQITSFAAKDSDKLDKNGIFTSHITVAKDTVFNEMLVNQQNTNERNVDVNALRADWILKTDEGLQYLSELSVSNDMELFDLDSIRTIVLFQWMYIRMKIIKYLFIPFVIYFSAFTTTVTFIYQKAENEEYKTAQVYLTYILTLGVILPLQIYFFIIECIQFHDQGFSYFKSFWNFFDIFTLFSCLNISILMLLENTSDGENYINVLGAGTVIILYIKFFYFLRIFESTASFIRMIVQMTIDIRIFIYIYFFAIMGFGNGFYLLSLTNEEEDQFVNNIVDGILFVYRMSLGDFDTENEFGKTHQWMVWLVFIVATLFIMIILLNLLIAIMGDTFGKVKETEEQSRIREYLQLILDNDFLVKRQEMFKDVKYIISVTLDKEKQRGAATSTTAQPIIIEQGSNSQQVEFLNHKFEEFTRNQEEFQQKLYTQIQGNNPDQQLNSMRTLSKRKTTILTKNITLKNPSIRVRHH